MRILGLDYGTKTVGVAVSDPLKMTAQPLETIERKSANKLRQTLARIEAILEEYGAAGERDPHRADSAWLPEEHEQFRGRQMRGHPGIQGGS